MTPDALATLHAAAFTTQRPWSADEFASLLSSKFVFLAPVSNGFALGRVIADEAELLTLAVAPSYQGQGLGRRAMAQYHAVAATKGACSSFLEVAETNLSARHLYDSLGYQQTGRRADYYRLIDGKMVAAVAMSCSITPGHAKFDL
ncbi:MAG: GNAT family N-acetyltransferase [Thalassovita sp.]